MIYIASKRSKIENIQKRFPNAIICDVTSTSPNALVRLSPFYPHGSIPVPFSEGVFACSVEGVWQGLKVFENEGISFETFSNNSMKNIKRTCKTHGKILGHKKGVYSNIILDYVTAKKEIYIPTYYWVLKYAVCDIVDRLAHVAKQHDIVLLDYNTTLCIESETKPLSHAYLLKLYLEEHYSIYEKNLFSNEL